MVAPGRCVWLLRGACMVAPGGRPAWLLWGGMHGCLGGVSGCSGGVMRGCSGGACVVFSMRYGQ